MAPLESAVPGSTVMSAAPWRKPCRAGSDPGIRDIELANRVYSAWAHTASPSGKRTRLAWWIAVSLAGHAGVAAVLLASAGPALHEAGAPMEVTLVFDAPGAGAAAAATEAPVAEPDAPPVQAAPLPEPPPQTEAPPPETPLAPQTEVPLRPVEPSPPLPPPVPAVEAAPP
ncbi:hypothetical protein OL599_25545, partial [Rhodovastum sp. RN2-1]|nr:hypothetical protein [Limobrevibacterium gyesilva]